MRILIALPGLHRIDRGAEVAFISIANELVRQGCTVTLIGSGTAKPDTPYRFLSAPCISRERFEGFPFFSPLRNECVYEELTFQPGLLKKYNPLEYDVTLTCGYPFTNWTLRRPVLRGSRPAHVFVTQNGDWPAYATNSEYRLFGCDGLICTNIEYFERNKDRWRCALIPNGVDVKRFQPGLAQREQFGLPNDRPVVLMVSALIPSKRVDVGIEAASRLPDVHLVVAGDGPLRQEIDGLAEQLLPGRFTRLTVTPPQMPDLYRSADVFLHMSMDESFGNVYIEAMACGLPIVAHDSPRTRWIMGDNEYLIDTREKKSILSAIQDAVRDGDDNRQKRSRRASRFAWPNIATNYRDFLDEVISARPSSTGR